MHAYRDQYAQILNNGQNAILIAISTDSVGALASWARDDQFQFLMASDVGTKVGMMYGAARSAAQTNRNLFVIGPDGKIAYRAVPFREVDPMAYTELAEAIKKTLPATPGN
ncbi:MAG: redoxin domain-containing protein [Gemmatimonadota bacterium]